MERREKIKRFILRLLIFCVGLVFLSLGIDLNTKTQLGISPINSVPFNVHQLAGIPLWICVYTLYLLFVLMQRLLLRKDFHPVQCFQLATSFICSILIQFFDDHIPLLTKPVSQYLVLVLAIVLTAVGISLTAGMKLIPNPGEGAAGAIGIALKRTSVTERTCWISAAWRSPLRSHSFFPAVYPISASGPFCPCSSQDAL